MSATAEKKKSQPPAKPRYAVAIYDFTGSAEQKTLTVFKGDILRIKEVTESNWWLGECSGVLGFVPRTYVCLKEVNWTPDGERTITSGSFTQYEDEEKETKDDDLTDDDDDDDSGKAYTVAIVGIYNFEKKDPRHLAFKKNDKFFIVEPLTPDQPWYEAKLNGEEGLVPANRVYILKPGETEAPRKKKDDADGKRGVAESEAGPTNDNQPSTPTKKKVYTMAIALRDYRAPNSEIKFTRGDTVEVESSSSSDWWPARFNGKQGVIPKQFVRLVDAANSSELKKELQFDYMTGNRDPSRSSGFGKRDIGDIPFFAALFALKAGLPDDTDVESGNRFGLRNTSVFTGKESSTKEDMDEDSNAPSSKHSNRLTNIVNAVRATREAASREQSEEAQGSGGGPGNSTAKGLTKPGKKTTMTAVISSNPNRRKTEHQKGITDKEVGVVEKQLRFHFLEDGMQLFSEGAEDEFQRAVYIILEGEFEIKVAGENYGSLRVGQFFGLDSLMVDSSKRSYTASAKGRLTIAMSIPFSGHRTLCKSLNWYEDAMRNLYKVRTGSHLQRLALFHRLDPQSLDFLGMRFTIRKLKKAQGVSEADDDATGSSATSGGVQAPSVPGTASGSSPSGQSPLEDGLFLVLSGLLSVTVKLADGTKRELRRMGPGQFFGEALLAGLDHQIGTATALVPSIILYLSRSDLQLYSSIDSRARAEVSRVARFRTADIMRNLPMLQAVPAAKHDILAAAFEFCVKREGEEFYAPGQNECMYVVCEGDVDLLDERGDSIRTVRTGMWFGEKVLTNAFDAPTVTSPRPGGKPLPLISTEDVLDGAVMESPLALGPNVTICIALSREGFERFLETAQELKPQLKHALQSMVTQLDATGLQMKNLIPTSADELACVTQLPSEFLNKDPEAKAALESWAEIGKIMAPCLKTLHGYPQYLHPMPFDFGGRRDPLRKFIVTIVKLDNRMDSIKIATSASETVGELVNSIFEKFQQQSGGNPLDPAGPNLFALKVASRADYLLERDVEMGRYKCVTAALRRNLEHGELKLALVDLRSNPRLGPGLRTAARRQEHLESSIDGTLMEAYALYDHDGGPNGLSVKAGDRLEVEPRIGEEMWPAVLAGSAAYGLIPQNIIKAIAPIVGPTRGPTNRRAFGLQATPMARNLAASSNAQQHENKDLLALPNLNLEEWAKAINEGFTKVEKLPTSWGKLAGSSSPPTAPPRKANAKSQTPQFAPWPLRIRIRGFERLFAVPGIERCGFLQVRVELVFGGQVLEKKLSKPVKRNSVLRFEDEWFYFSKSATDLGMSTRITLTLLGLDINGAQPLGRSPSFDDMDEGAQNNAIGGGGPSAEVVRRMDSQSTITPIAKEGKLGFGKITQMFGRGRKPSTTAARLRGGTGSISVQDNISPRAGNGDSTATLGENSDSFRLNNNSAADREIELAGVAFPLWGADLVLRGGVMSFGLWNGQAGDRALYCVENFEQDAARVLVELDKYAEPVRYVMPPAVPLAEPSAGVTGRTAPPTKPPPRAEIKGNPANNAKAAGIDAKSNATKNMKNRRTSVSVFVARQHMDQAATTQPGGAPPSDRPQVSKKVQEILARNPLQVYQMSEVEKSLVWSEREALVGDPFALSKALLSVNWGNPIQRDQALQILSRWAVPAPMQALELLDARFGEYRVREYAVKCLEEFDDEELSDFLLQLIQVLKFEAFHDSPLARFLFRRALANPREIGNKMFWGLRAEMHLKKFAPRFGLMLKAYLRACGPHFAELAQQHDAQELLKSVAKAAQRMKNVTKAERTAMARAAIAQVNERMPRVFQLPLDPRMRAMRFNPESCRIMSSKKRPLWMSLESVDPLECGGEPMLVMFKVGDDLRQDQMTLQIIRVLEQIWLAEGMNMRLTPYGCISTGDELGMLEIVPDSETIAHIETTQGGTFGSLKDTPIRKFLEYHNKGSVDQAIDNFVRSCAGYCVATYIIGIGDRHNDNILCCRDGRLFHIDFGHFLGNFKTVAALGGFKRERTPFVLTKGMAYAMGGKGTEEFTRFVELSCKAFNIIRSHGDELVTMFRLMVPAGMPELKSDEDIQYLVDQLHLGKSDEEATQIFRAEINSAIGDFYRRVDNFLHTVIHS